MPGFLIMSQLISRAQKLLSVFENLDNSATHSGKAADRGLRVCRIDCQHSLFLVFLCLSCL